MGELLHSVPHSCTPFFNSSSLTTWDHLHQHLGVFNSPPGINPDMSLGGGCSELLADPFFSATESDVSTGYLEDALVKFNGTSKRRRLLSHDPDDHQNTGFDVFDERRLWEANWDWGVLTTGNFSCMSQLIADVHGASEDNNETKTSEVETASEFSHEALDSSSSSYRDSAAKSKPVMIPSSAEPTSSFGKTAGSADSLQKKKRPVGVLPRMVYPFALVKPGGRDGDVTLDDINERILMPPTRPLRHPVGDYACRPCVSPSGPGLSGKAVVALTRIHTQGRGTITIIRTRG